MKNTLALKVKKYLDPRLWCDTTHKECKRSNCSKCCLFQRVIDRLRLYPNTTWEKEAVAWIHINLYPCNYCYEAKNKKRYYDSCQFRSSCVLYTTHTALLRFLGKHREIKSKQ